MALLFLAPDKDQNRWKKALLNEDPNLDLYLWPDVDHEEAVNFVVCWDHPPYVLNRFPNLQAVASLGAGVDHILNDDQLPDHVPVCRTLTPRLKREMVDYILTGLAMHRRNIPFYMHQQRKTRWSPYPNQLPEDLEVGLMGLGAIGRRSAEILGDAGYRVRGWARSDRSIEQVNVYAGDKQLTSFLDGLDALICLLPLTPQTRDILDLEVFKALNDDALLINIARGEHLIDEDLVFALDRDELGWAMIDVFDEEPLSENHPFWNRPEILVTPHIGGITPPEEAAEIIIDNYKRAMSGMELQYKVDRTKGY